MSWAVVNARSQHLPSTQVTVHPGLVHPQVYDLRPNYRTQLLASAERCVKSRTSHKRQALTDTANRNQGKLKRPSSDGRKSLVSMNICKTDLLKKSVNSTCASEKLLAYEKCPDKDEILKKGGGRQSQYTLTESIFNKLPRGKDPFLDDPRRSTSKATSARASDGIVPAIIVRSSSDIIEISSDEGTLFGEEFDDSLFDDAFEIDATDCTSRVLTTKFDQVEPADDPLSINPERSRSKEAEPCGMPKAYPNGAPFPPFMHPHLLYTLDPNTRTWNLDSSTNQTIMYTCFRVAEVFRLNKAVEIQSVSEQHDFIVDLFATVRRVTYANSSGYGQGIVFSDCFFPHKPPYIAATSKSPFSLRDLILSVDEPQTFVDIVCATIKCVKTLSQTKATNDVQQLRTPPAVLKFEVLDVRHTSWDELGKLRDTIQTDFHDSLRGLAQNSYKDTGLEIESNIYNTSMIVEAQALEEPVIQTRDVLPEVFSDLSGFSDMESDIY